MNLLTCLAIIASLLVVTSTNTVLSIVWLVVVFLVAACLLSFYSLSYVALTYVIVYVGAIAILFLFVVQLLDQRNHLLERPTFKSLSFHAIAEKTRGKKHDEQETTMLKEEHSSSTFSSSLFFSLLIMLFLFTEINQSLPIFKDWFFFNEIDNLFAPLSKGYSSYISVVSEPTLQEVLQLSPMKTHLNEDIISAPLSVTKQYNSLSTLNDVSNTLNGYIALSLQETNITYSSQIQNFGEWLYGGASLALIIVSVILLLAMVGPIVVCWSLV